MRFALIDAEKEKFRQEFSSLVGLRHLASLRGVLVMALPTH